MSAMVTLTQAQVIAAGVLLFILIVLAVAGWVAFLVARPRVEVIQPPPSSDLGGVARLEAITTAAFRAMEAAASGGRTRKEAE
jgi:hypothetical protein